jgi:hypothetical protein
MSFKIIPLTADPDQTFICTLPIDSKNITLRFRFRYNTEAGYWFMTILDANTNEYILDSVPMVDGNYPAADLLGQYSYMGLGSATIIKRGESNSEIPGEYNLGSEYLLIWGDTIE